MKKQAMVPVLLLLMIVVLMLVMPEDEMEEQTTTWRYPAVMMLAMFPYFLITFYLIAESSPFRVYEDMIVLPIARLYDLKRELSDEHPLSDIETIYPHNIWSSKKFVSFTIGFLLMNGQRFTISFGDTMKDLNRSLKKSKGHKVLEILRSVYGEKWTDIYVQTCPFGKYSYIIEKGRGISKIKAEDAESEGSTFTSEEIHILKRQAEKIQENVRDEDGKFTSILKIIMIAMPTTIGFALFVTSYGNISIIWWFIAIIITAILYYYNNRIVVPERRRKGEQEWRTVRERFREAVRTEIRTGEILLPPELQLTKLYKDTADLVSG